MTIKMAASKIISFFVVCVLLFISCFPNMALAAEQVSLTATIEPSPTDLEILISGIPPAGSTLSQNQEATITISYKSSSSGVFPATIEGAWEQGLIEGTSSSYIDILEYVVGSATQADNGTNPVVDTVNRKVTWALPSISSTAAYHTVSFKLKVRSDIPTDNNVSVNIRARGTFSSTTLPEESISYTVKRIGGPGATPTPTQTPNPTSSPATNAGPIVTPLPKTQPVFNIDYVRIDEIGDTYFDVSFQTNRQSTYALIYGENPNSLTQKISSLTYETRHLVKLVDLKPQTQYYFKIIATDQAGNSVTSDLFTAKTASGKSTITLSHDDFTIHWRKYFLLSSLVDTVVIPKNMPVTITAKLGDSSSISKIKAYFKNEKVLGLNNNAPPANIGETPLIEILPGIFSGEIQSPSQNGVYSILFEITDTKGGLYTKTTPYKFYNSDPLRVMDKKTRKPIESAEVKITKYQESLKQFAPLGKSFAIVSKTNEKGELDIVLPTGVYYIEVKHPHHKSQNKKIEMGISAISYPLFELESESALHSITSYYQESINDLADFTLLTAKSFFSSQRAKDLYLIFALLLLLVLILLDTHIKKHVGLTRTLITFSILDVFIVLSGVATLLFVNYLGVSDTALLVAITLFIFILGTIYVRRTFFGKKT